VNLDASRHDVVARKKQPAPRLRSKNAIEADPVAYCIACYLRFIDHLKLIGDQIRIEIMRINLTAEVGAWAKIVDEAVEEFNAEYQPLWSGLIDLQSKRNGKIIRTLSFVDREIDETLPPAVEHFFFQTRMAAETGRLRRLKLDQLDQIGDNEQLAKERDGQIRKDLEDIVQRARRARRELVESVRASTQQPSLATSSSNQVSTQTRKPWWRRLSSTVYPSSPNK
jgi:hypothetical protein